MSTLRHRLGRLLVALAATLIGNVDLASAQRIEIVHAFPASPQLPRGKLLELSPGVFIGTSYAGGAYSRGSVYLLYRRADASWATFTLHSFHAAGGQHPVAGVIRASDGNFYGTTTRSGYTNYGTIFRLTPSLQLTTLHTFTDADGHWPNTALVQAPDGSLWGTTPNGGGTNSNAGTLFRMTLAGQFTKVHTFQTTADDGGVPGQLVLSSADGHLYGTTAHGGGQGDNGSGTVFRVTQAGTYSTLHSFLELGGEPFTLIEATDGHLYGVRGSGGATSVGFAFRVTRTGVYTKLHDFHNGDVWSPISGSFTQAPDGFIYGTTSARLVGSTPVLEGGAVYRMSLAGAVQRVADLDASTFGGPPSDLIVASDGGLYGTTRHGQRPEEFVDAIIGVMFNLPLSGPATVLYNFGTAAPRYPLGRLVEGPDGKLYGTSCAGGRYDRGTVFRIDGSETTTLHSFTGGDGVCPVGGLAVGSDGAFYGTAVGGQTTQTSGGTIYRITSGGAHTTLWSSKGGFGSDDPATPLAALAKGADGLLYVPFFGMGGREAVMRVEADSTVTRFGDFPGGLVDGGHLAAGALLPASDGHLYGTTSSSPGSVFRLSLDGAVTTVHQFPYEPGTSRVSRRSGLIQAADGRLYGASERGGSLDAGIVYSTDLSGSTSVLHQFTYADGNGPTGELIETSPGRFIGVTTGVQDPRYGLFGTLFEVTSAGGFQTLDRFNWWNGAGPFSGLTRSSSGQIYGTTTVGGPLGGGVIFRLVPSEQQREQ